MNDLVEMYSILGLNFEYHKHGKSPYHYSTEINETVLEIYPLAKNQNLPDNNLRLGFKIDDFDLKIAILKEKNIVFINEPIETQFGFMAIIEDIDGRKIELYK